MEKKDIAQLKKRLGELKGMQNNISKDLEDCEHSRASLLREREHQLMEMSHSGGVNRSHSRRENRLKMRVLAALELVEQSKTSMMGIDQEMLQKIAEEMKMGNDKLYHENRTDVLNIYNSSNLSL